MTVEIVGTETHGDAFGVFDAVQSGDYELGHSASYYWKDRDPNFLFFTTMPFGMLPVEQYAWFYHGGGQALMNEAYESYGLLSYPGGNTGSQMGGWFQKRIRSQESLRGLRMRIPGFAGELMSDLGVDTVNVPAGDMSDAFKRGDLDAAEWVGPSLDFDLDLHLVAPFYYTGWHEPATELQFLVNRDAMRRLPEDLQLIMETAMRLAAYDMYVQSIHVSAEQWTEMRQKFPVIRVKDFPDDVLEALRVSNERALERFAGLSPLTRRIVESQASYMRDAREWTLISDYSYLESIGR
ncbi:ABC transporter substrate-binding protein [Saccharospirillum salsuginis]|uniref:ABC transporter substrate-binding protein n=2 Tax=Saccharospirillum salsuginis TaxID=418750 RepID=A0A918NCB9_9GAMM|nr:ABC transporter substrate-binding protein [Saccharospirillum salsuginis]